MNKTLLLAMLGLTIAAAPVFAADMTVKSETKIEKDSDGDITAKTKTTKEDDNGTDVTTEKKVDVDADDNGDFKKTTESTTKTDPKGLFNSSKSKTKETVEKKDGVLHHEKKVNGETVIDTKTEAAH